MPVSHVIFRWHWRVLLAFAVSADVCPLWGFFISAHLELLRWYDRSGRQVAQVTRAEMVSGPAAPFRGGEAALREFLNADCCSDTPLRLDFWFLFCSI